MKRDCANFSKFEACEADAQVELQRFGVRLPRGVDDDIAAAVAGRLTQAEKTEEEEMFTGCLLVEKGVASAGLGVLVRHARSRGSRQPHVFLYNYESIQRWLYSQGTDPLTREYATPQEVLPLLALAAEEAPESAEQPFPHLTSLL
jgi:hypothetical protein